MAGNSRDIVYRSVFEAKNAPEFTMVNLIAKVAEFSFRKKSNGGTDYFLVVKIVDRSSPFQGLAVNVFAPNADSLPNIDSAGSTIVCFHQVQVKKHFDDTYCCFVKRKSSFALYNGNPTDIRLDPYQVSADYQATAHLSEILVQLRKFSPKKHPYDD